MQDRVPLYPGRVTLTPVSGQANTYDLTRADQPTQEGTPLNKASLLKDATAALYGLPNTAVPDDVLYLLPSMINNRAKIETGSYVGTGTYGASNPNSLTFGFAPKLVFVTYDPYKEQSSFILFIYTKTRGSSLPSNDQITSTWSGNTLSWYSPNNVDYQYNGSGKIGHYIAIG